MPYGESNLSLYVDNDGDIYRLFTRPAQQELATKKANGTYSRSDAVRAFTRVINEGVRRYQREIGPQKFSAAERNEAVKDMVDYFETEYGIGNFNHLLPASAKSKAPAKKKTAAQIQREINQALSRK